MRMKPTFKVDKLGRINPTEKRLGTKRLSLRPKKSMTRSKSLKPFVMNNQVAVSQSKTEE